jgi:hypothetical protein
METVSGVPFGKWAFGTELSDHKRQRRRIDWSPSGPWAKESVEQSNATAKTIATLFFMGFSSLRKYIRKPFFDGMTSCGLRLVSLAREQSPARDIEITGKESQTRISEAEVQEH